MNFKAKICHLNYKQFQIQGRIGASNQPWQGSWNGNVSVELVTCNPAIANFGNMANLGWDRGSVRL